MGSRLHLAGHRGCAAGKADAGRRRVHDMIRNEQPMVAFVLAGAATAFVAAVATFVLVRQRDFVDPAAHQTFPADPQPASAAA
jgi:hypothetical protein